MSEVEKMYENCNIKPKREVYCDWDSDCPYPDIINSGCGDECPYWKYEDEATYPPFTAEKQLELIKGLAKHYGNIHILNNAARGFAIGIEGVSFNLKKFEEIIAMVLNCFWQDLTEQERTEIAEILRG